MNRVYRLDELKIITVCKQVYKRRPYGLIIITGLHRGIWTRCLGQVGIHGRRVEVGVGCGGGGGGGEG